MYAQGGVTCMRRAVLHVCAGRCYMYAQGGVTCMRRAVLHIRPLRTPLGVPFPKGTVCPNTSGGRAPSSQPLLETTIFGLIVHAYSCYQSENVSSLCLLKRVIDLIVLNHSI